MCLDPEVVVVVVVRASLFLNLFPKPELQPKALQECSRA